MTAPRQFGKKKIPLAGLQLTPTNGVAGPAGGKKPQVPRHPHSLDPVDGLIARDQRDLLQPNDRCTCGHPLSVHDNKGLCEACHLLPDRYLGFQLDEEAP